MALRYGGQLDAAYRGEKTIFRPNLAQRPTASALETAVSISRALERQLGRFSGNAPAPVRAVAGCGPRWEFYCGAVSAAVEYTLQRGRAVIVAGQPYISASHVEQQELMASMLRERFGGNRGLTQIDLGRVVDLHDPALAWDGMHLTARGNELLAVALVPVVSRALK